MRIWHLDIVKFLMDNREISFIQKNNALKHACFNYHINIVDYLVEKGSNLNSISKLVLIYSINHHNLSFIKYLIKKKDKYRLRRY